MTDIFSYLKERPYPGRGIMLGKTVCGDLFCAYFIMGRSENSRNRIFEATPDGLRTSAFDFSLMSDPSLIIYHPVRDLNEGFIVSNGDQTDTIRASLKSGGSIYDALSLRCFEPDKPNYTPRISGVCMPSGENILSILKTDDGENCDRYYYSYYPAPGEARFISTYEGMGSPLPSFSGEPIRFNIPQGDTETVSNLVWDALNEDNRISLYVLIGDKYKIINKNIRRQ